MRDGRGPAFGYICAPPVPASRIAEQIASQIVRVTVHTSIATRNKCDFRILKLPGRPPTRHTSTATRRRLSVTDPRGLGGEPWRARPGRRRALFVTDNRHGSVGPMCDASQVNRHV